jgi:hypothetical protein
MNCIQNQITIADRVLLRNKVATFIITGGQDNIQGVAGQLLTFFSEVGFHFPQFPFIAHSRGWDAEDMERNMDVVEKSEDLREGARQLVTRALASRGCCSAKAPAWNRRRGVVGRRRRCGWRKGADGALVHGDV